MAVVRVAVAVVVVVAESVVVGMGTVVVVGVGRGFRLYQSVTVINLAPVLPQTLTQLFGVRSRGEDTLSSRHPHGSNVPD